MKPVRLLFGAVSIMFPNVLGSQVTLSAERLTGTTGAAVLLDSEPVYLAAMTEEEYRKTLAPVVGSSNIIRIQYKPEGLSRNARYGFNLGLANDPRVLSWILDGDEQSGYTLFVDLNANGDLRDDTAIRLGRGENEYSYTFAAHSALGLSRLVIREVTLGGSSKPTLSIQRYRMRLRRGEISLGKRTMAFGLVAGSGRYFRAVFDLNGDGKLNVDAGSPESYDASETYVRLPEGDFEFIIEPNGDELGLRPLAQPLAPGQVMRAGYPAPDFQFTDLQGKLHRLSDFRGRIVLLDFWTISCGPCQAAIPKLAAAYAKYRDKGFEIVGINGEDSADTLRPFLKEKGMVWPQTAQEKTDGPIHKLYRYDSWPLYYLVGRDGTILVRRLGNEDFLAQLDRLLAQTR
ncbi:MAG TPA: hypothetical protein DEH78_19900 [Solibacterales bacterium]|nr:hypothetical protein [Bryobacterales bacterium]